MRDDGPATRFEPVRVLLPSEEVARRLGDAIRGGFFRVGSRLPSERTMAEQMQVSRQTVREAVKLLAAAGNLTGRPGAGGGTFVVNEIVPLDFIIAAPEMSPGGIDEALEVRRLILPWVAKTASHYAEDQDFTQMREAIAFGRDALPDPIASQVSTEHVQSTIVATIRFDLAVARATRNRLLVRLTDSLLHWVEPLRFRTLRQRSDLVLALDLCEAMMAAIESGDPIRVMATTERRMIILETALEEINGRKLRRRQSSS